VQSNHEEASGKHSLGIYFTITNHCSSRHLKLKKDKEKWKELSQVEGAGEILSTR
jgi:hypothetical protein